MEGILQPTHLILAMLLVMYAPLYVYFSLALQVIAKKTATGNSWLAWVPIADMILELDIAKKPRWWLVLRLLPPISIFSRYSFGSQSQKHAINLRGGASLL
jgi:hypothetical protein